jgi:uncharacterized protein YdiU (UPF0061 family)
MRFPLDNQFFTEMEGFYAPAEAAVPSAPHMLAFNDALAAELGLGDVDLDQMTRWLSGAELPDGATPLAFAYAGHQFGHFSPQLGDGRALLLGEIVAPDGQRYDVQLKGSGPTPFSRNGDGKAAIGPVLREYLVSEAMAAMGISTTRALAAVATGDRVQRERGHPGAVLTRIAASHIRVGTFQFFAAHLGESFVTKLVHYAIKRHYPDIADAKNPALALLDKVIERQCALVASWMGVGFVHGVMNTDNVAISGEVIDYGPCAFVDHFKAGAVFSSIDRNGRYAYGRQPHILHWNMARLAEALLPSIHAVEEADVEAAKALANEVPQRFRTAWEAVLRAKLGLGETAQDGDRELFETMFAILEEQAVDFTGYFRALGQYARGDQAALTAHGGEAWRDWLTAWEARAAGRDEQRAEAMDRVNPLYIPRNHLVEAALAAAEDGDLSGWENLLQVVRTPFAVQAGREEYVQPSDKNGPAYRTFCGT